MSASLQLSTGTLAADGKTVTAPILNGTAPFTISSTTGINLKRTDTSVAFWANTYSVAINGSNVVFVTDVPFGSTDTLVIELDTSSNLRDSAGNSPTGQLAVPVTNNSTQKTLVVGALTAASSGAFGGEWSYHANSGDDYVQPGGSWTNQLIFQFTGTDAAIRLYGGGDHCYVSIDGGSANVVNNNGSLMVNAGLRAATNTVHTVLITLPTYSYVNSWMVLSSPTATPVITQPPTYGTQVPLQVGGTFNTSIACDAGRYTGSTYGLDYVAWPNTGDIRFTAQTSNIRAYLYSNSTSYPLAFKLWVDGVFNSYNTLTLPNGNQNALLFGGLDGSAPHEYMIELLTGGGVANNENLIYSLMFDGVGLLPIPHPTNTVEAWGFIGDSEMGAGIAAIGYDQVASYLIGKQCGVATINVQRGGQGIAYAISTEVPQVTDRLQLPTAVCINIGVNDTTLNFNTGAGTFQTSYGTMLSNLRTAAPNARIICESIWNVYYAGYPATAGSYNAAIKNAVAAFNDPNTFFIDTVTTNPWLPDILNGSNGGDANSGGIHELPGDQPTIANCRIPYLTEYAYSITGPSSGTANAASGQFTVTRAMGTVWKTGDAVTLNVSNGATITAAGGTFTNNSTSVVTVTPTIGNTSFTFTVTAPGAGKFTISGTNNQSWPNNPPSVVYFANQSVGKNAMNGTAIGVPAGYAAGSFNAIAVLPDTVLASATGASLLSGSPFEKVLATPTGSTTFT